MKMIILVSILFLSVTIFVPHVLAQSTTVCDPTKGFCALAPISGLTDQTTADSVAKSKSFADFFNNLYKYLIGLAAILAIIEIIWGGLEISTKDSVSKQSDGKERITQAIFGLVLVLSPVLVFSIVNPSILNLSLSLKPLDTKRTYIPPSTTPKIKITSDSVVSENLSVCLDNDCGGAAADCKKKSTVVALTGSAFYCLNSSSLTVGKDDIPMTQAVACPAGKTLVNVCSTLVAVPSTSI